MGRARLDVGLSLLRSIDGFEQFDFRLVQSLVGLPYLLFVAPAGALGFFDTLLRAPNFRLRLLNLPLDLCALRLFVAEGLLDIDGQSGKA